MREKSINESDIRICAGGKTTGYTGKMPGVLEEFLIAVDNSKPIYLIGGLGGIVKDICESIRNKTIVSTLTQDWQIAKNKLYADLLTVLESNGYSVNYDEIKDKLMDLDISVLSKNTGLTSEEYIKLMETPFIDEIIHLILKGLRNI